MWFFNASGQSTSHYIYDLKGNITTAKYIGSNPCPKPYQRILIPNDSTKVGDENFILKPFFEPMGDLLKIEFDVKSNPRIDIKVLDANNALISNLVQNEIIYDGNYSKLVDIKNLPQGLYFIRVQVNDKVYTKKIFKLE